MSTRTFRPSSSSTRSSALAKKTALSPSLITPSTTRRVSGPMRRFSTIMRGSRGKALAQLTSGSRGGSTTVGLRALVEQAHDGAGNRDLDAGRLERLLGDLEQQVPRAQRRERIGDPDPDLDRHPEVAEQRDD